MKTATTWKGKSDRPSPAAERELMNRFYSWLYERSMQREKARRLFKSVRRRGGFIVKA